MRKIIPKDINLDETPEWLRKATIEWFEFEDNLYPVRIVSTERLPTVLPYGVGMFDGKFLFISENVPRHRWYVLLGHELQCCRFNKEKPGRCAEAVKWELENIPPEEKYEDYLRDRLAFFEALVIQNRESGDRRNIQQEIERSLEFLQRKVAGLDK